MATIILDISDCDRVRSLAQSLAAEHHSLLLWYFDPNKAKMDTVVAAELVDEIDAAGGIAFLPPFEIMWQAADQPDLARRWLENLLSPPSLCLLSGPKDVPAAQSWFRVLDNTWRPQQISAIDEMTVEGWIEVLAGEKEG